MESVWNITQSERNLLLQELAEDLGTIRTGRGAEDVHVALAMISAVASVAGEPDPDRYLATEDGLKQVSCRLLERMSADELTDSVFAQLTEHPTNDSRLALDADGAVTYATVLGALVAWLQLRIDFEISRRSGKIDVKFKIGKEPASQGLLTRVASALVQILRGGGGA